MGLQDRINTDYEPYSKQVSTRVLLSLLKTPRKVKFFCGHNWVYWKNRNTTRSRRICSKCYKRQQNKDLIKASNIWYKDTRDKHGK